ncbi:MAG: EAL domain-containing protein [Steroidobacteraceae bacterium]
MLQLSLPPTVRADVMASVDLSPALLAALPDAVVACETDGSIVFTNPAVEPLRGYCAAELIGSDLRDKLPGIAALLSQAGGSGTRIPFNRADGARLDLHVNCAAVDADARPLRLLTMRAVPPASGDSPPLRVGIGEREVFEHIGRNSPLPVALLAVARWMMQSLGNCQVAVNVLNESGSAFTLCAGPDIAPALRAALLDCQFRDGDYAPPARRHLDRVCVSSIVGNDEGWNLARSVVVGAGHVGAWSRPVVSASGRPLGVMLVLHPCSRELADGDRELLLHASRLAALAIERHVAEQALRASEERFRGLYEHMMEGVFECTPEGTLLSINPALVTMLGYSTAQQLIERCGSRLPFCDQEEGAALLRRLTAFGECRDAEFELTRHDGHRIVVLLNARLEADRAGEPMTLQGTVANITERKRAERLVLEEKERAQVTLQSIGEAVIRTDASGLIDYMNPIAETLTGWPLYEGKGRLLSTVMKLLDETTRAEVPSPLMRCLRDDAASGVSEQALLQGRNGQDVAIDSSVAPIRNRRGEIIGAVTVFRDVTRERRLKRALSYQAAHDALTGLINRREFDARLQTAVETARGGGPEFALLYVDLDQFKIVNDTCGHPAGDRLLRDVTALLQGRVRATDVIARLGGDEFGVLLQGCPDDEARKIAESIRSAVRDYRFLWNENSMSIGASIGLVRITRETESVATVLSAADIACYAAKDSGRNRVHVYDTGAGSGRHREMYWVARVTRAVEENRLDLLAQPIRRVRDDAVRTTRGFRELLVRLRDEHGRLVSPGEFIPAAERYNVMGAIDRWVVERAVAELRRLPPGSTSGLRDPLFSVNLSGTSLNDAAFVDFVLSALEDRDVAGGLCFEITETAAVANLHQAAYFMRELRARGCRFALDDFGSGLSSFRYLKALPVDYLKIDGQFVGNVAVDPMDRSMVEAICHMARTLGIRTVAERVESVEVLDCLQRLGVDYVQGYFVGMPEPLPPVD